MIVNMATKDKTIVVLKNIGLVLKIVERLLDYLSCEVNLSEHKKRAWLGQPHIIMNTKKKFGELIHESWSHKTPGMPNFLIFRPMVEGKKISTEDQ